MKNKKEEKKQIYSKLNVICRSQEKKGGEVKGKWAPIRNPLFIISRYFRVDFLVHIHTCWLKFETSQPLCCSNSDYWLGSLVLSISSSFFSLSLIIYHFVSLQLYVSLSRSLWLCDSDTNKKLRCNGKKTIFLHRGGAQFKSDKVCLTFRYNLYFLFFFPFRHSHANIGFVCIFRMSYRFKKVFPGKWFYS